MCRPVSKIVPAVSKHSSAVFSAVVLQAQQGKIVSCHCSCCRVDVWGSEGTATPKAAQVRGWWGKVLGDDARPGQGVRGRQTPHTDKVDVVISANTQKTRMCLELKRKV